MVRVVRFFFFFLSLKTRSYGQIKVQRHRVYVCALCWCPIIIIIIISIGHFRGCVVVVEQSRRFRFYCPSNSRNKEIERNVYNNCTRKYILCILSVCQKNIMQKPLLFRIIIWLYRYRYEKKKKNRFPTETPYGKSDDIFNDSLLIIDWCSRCVMHTHTCREKTCFFFLSSESLTPGHVTSSTGQ